jgi:uncharacterized protein
MSATTVDRFARLKALQPPLSPPTTGLQAPPEVKDAAGIAAQTPARADKLTKILAAATSCNKFGEHLVVRRRFSEPVACVADPAALQLLAPNAPEEMADPNQWLFLDTETTGLAGGTGTYAFLVGIAWWHEGGLEVEQFFMREHSEECSLLVALAERLQERRVLVTFNGKSFDWPLLETRYCMTRAVTPPKLRAHLDLLHPARSLWRLRLGSVRLPELERHVLGWNRGADVMSELIPRIYLDFVRGGSPEPLVPIFHHNQMDLCGLAALTSRVLSLFASPETCGRDGLELFGVSRICERRGQLTRARELYQQSLASALPAETDHAARGALARLAKRGGDFGLACELWNHTLGNSREGYEAYEQLAIYYEHRAGEPQRAVEVARTALAELRRASRLGTITPAAYEQRRTRFEHRLARLERKAHPSLLDALD